MRIVVDTNILFSFFWRNSLTRKILETSRFELISPSLSLDEIKKYKNHITGKAKIDNGEFLQILKELGKRVTFVKASGYGDHLGEAKRISPDRSDADFFALCLREKTFLWSNDSLLKKQDKIDVLSTKEIIDLFFD